LQAEKSIDPDKKVYKFQPERASTGYGKSNFSSQDAGGAALWSGLRALAPLRDICRQPPQKTHAKAQRRQSRVQTESKTSSRTRMLGGRKIRKTLWLVADDPDGSWWCRCRTGIVDAPYHNRDMHPGGGTGWLWFCAQCRRSFMFAKCAYIRGTLEQLAEKQTPRVQKEITMSGEMTTNVVLATPQDWLESVRPILGKIDCGERYVYFDGCALPAKHGPIRFDGLFRSHDLPDLPHLSETLAEQTIANPDYWHGT
jgi:hypothetical protein